MNKCWFWRIDFDYVRTCREAPKYLDTPQNQNQTLTRILDALMMMPGTLIIWLTCSELMWRSSCGV